MPLAVWQAQRERERRGQDVPAPGPGWPRPVVDGAPHPWITPVSDGWPWWRLTHGERVLQAQNDWLCQMCGLPLDQLAWVVLDGVRVVTDTALHHRCLALATGVCPHLIAALYPVAEISRDDILGDGHPLPARGAAWRQQWTVRPGAAALAS